MRLVIATIAIIALIVTAAALTVARIPFSSETLRSRIIATLRDRLDAEVELGSVTLRILPHFEVRGESLVIRHRGRRDVAPLFKFIHKYYEPAFFEVFLGPKDILGIYRAVLNVLSGGSFMRITWRVRASLAVLFAVARINGWVRRLRGRPVESRLEW